MRTLKYPVVGGENKISQRFGTNPDGYPDFYKQFGYIGHNGIDFYGAKNDYIFAACDGRVSLAHYDSTGYGNLVVIVDSDGGQHYYAHQNSIACKVGDYLYTGNLVGYMGNTGNVIGGQYSDGTHLHYGYRPSWSDRNNGYGGFVDPLPYFEKEDLPEMVLPPEANQLSARGWAEVVCDFGVNVRGEPAGVWRTWFPKGVRVYKTGHCEEANGLLWEQIEGGYYVARTDSENTILLKDVNE